MYTLYVLYCVWSMFMYIIYIKLHDMIQQHRSDNEPHPTIWAMTKNHHSIIQIKTLHSQENLKSNKKQRNEQLTEFQSN